MKKFILSLAIFTLLPLSVAADQVVVLPYNYLFDGDVFINGLSASSSLCTDINKMLTTSGCSGGGGGVSSVTSGSTHNLTFAPTTGAVIGDLIASPSVSGFYRSQNAASGTVSGFGFYAGQGGVSANIPQALGFTLNSGSPNNTSVGANSANSIGGVSGACLDIGDYAGNTLSQNLLTMDCSGNMGVTGSVTSAATGAAFITPNAVFGQWAASTADTIQQSSNGTYSVQGVTNSAEGVTDPTNTFHLMAMSTGGDVGFRLGVHAANLTGANLTSGQCAQAGAGGELFPSGAPCGTPPLLIPVTGATLPTPLAVETFNGTQTNAPVGMTIGHINVSCETYNAADAAANHLATYTPLDSNGLGGGTVNFGIMNATFSGSSPFNLGSVVIPDSPQAGPWVTSVTSAVGTPYTILPGDNLVILPSAVSGTATQWVSQCVAYIGN